jgi:Outer membrane protein beta-barrel domain
MIEPRISRRFSASLPAKSLDIGTTMPAFFAGNLTKNRRKLRGPIIEGQPLFSTRAIRSAMALHLPRRSPRPEQSDPMKPRAPLQLSLMLGLVLAASTSHAQSNPRLDQDYLALGLALGFAGTVTVNSDAVQTDEAMVTALSADSPLGLSVGGAARYVFGLHPYFALGAQFGFDAWRSQQAAAQDRAHSWLFEVGIVPQARLPLDPRLELYLAVPVGLTLSALSEAETWIQLLAADNPMFSGVADVDPRFGYSIGAMLGVRFALVDHFGVLLELGYLRDAVVHPVDVRFSEGTNGTQVSLEIVTHQFGICAGVFF